MAEIEVFGPDGVQFPQTEAEHSKLLNQVLDCFREAKAFRQAREQRWRRYYRLYRSYVKRRENDWHSQRFIPIVFYVVETIMPKLVAQLPKMICNPVEETDVEPAKLMEDLLEWSADRAKLYVELVAAYRSALKYGTGVLKTFHMQQTVKRRTQAPVMEPISVPSTQPVMDPETGQQMYGIDGQPMNETVQVSLGERPKTDPTTGAPVMKSTTEDAVLYDGPGAEAIDIFNFWPAPFATSIEDASYVLHRAFKDSSYVKEMLRQGVFQMPPGMSEASDFDGQTTEPAAQRQSEVGQGGTSGSLPKRAEILEYWTDAIVITVLNSRFVVRVQENPFAHGQKPFVRILDYFQEHEFWGIGEIEPLEGLQDLENTIVNQRIDNVRLAMNKMMAVNEDQLVDRRDIASRPGGVIRVHGNAADPRVALMPIPQEDVTSSAYTEAAEIERLSEKVSSVSAYQTGTDSPTLNDTATGVAIISEQGNSRFALKVRMAELTGLSPLARHFGEILQQFAPENLVVRRQGAAGKFEWQQVSAEGIQGALDYDIEAESSTVTESLRKEQSMGLLTAMVNTAVALQNPQLVNFIELVQDVFRAYGYKNIDQLMTPPPPQAPPQAPGIPDQVPPGAPVPPEQAGAAGMLAPAGAPPPQAPAPVAA